MLRSLSQPSQNLLKFEFTMMNIDSFKSVHITEHKKKLIKDTIKLSQTESRLIILIYN